MLLPLINTPDFYAYGDHPRLLALLEQDGVITRQMAGSQYINVWEDQQEGPPVLLTMVVAILPGHWIIQYTDLDMIGPFAVRFGAFRVETA